jgi:hypothetical protein
MSARCETLDVHRQLVGQPMARAYRIVTMQPGVLPFVFLAAFAATTRAADVSGDRWMVQVELDPSETTSNTLQRPNNSAATRFDIVDYTGGNTTLGRLTLAYVVDWGHPGGELQLDIVPFQQSGTRVPASTLRYNGATFQAGIPLTALYQFNTYRLTYDVPLFANASDRWTFHLGGTLAIRDAQTRLQQPGVRTNYVNFGPVPLLFAYSAWRVSDTWRLESDLDAFPAPGGGGLLDTSARVVWLASRHASFFGGGRYQAGGATGDTFYNFLHQRSALVGFRFDF